MSFAHRSAAEFTISLRSASAAGGASDSTYMTALVPLSNARSYHHCGLGLVKRLEKEGFPSRRPRRYVHCRGIDMCIYRLSDLNPDLKWPSLRLETGYSWLNQKFCALLL